MIIAFADLRLAIDALHIDDPNVLLAPGSMRKAWNDAIDRALALIDQHAARAAEDVTEARAELRRDGKHVGGDVPYGRMLGEDGRTLLEHEAEAAIVELARALRTGGYSYAGISRQLAKRNMFARTGKNLAPAQVRRMVLSGQPSPVPAAHGTTPPLERKARTKGKAR